MNKRNTTRVRIALSVLLLAAVVVPAVAQAQQTVEITVTSRGFDFTPEEIRVNLGDRVVLTYENGGGFHDWVLDEFDAATRQISGGQSQTIEFVADKAGEFEFYCSVGNHRARGMVGTFIVEP